MTAALIYFVLALLLLTATTGAYAARVYGQTLSFIVSTAGMMVVFFIPQFIILGLFITALVHHEGGLEHPIGRLGLVVHVGCWLALEPSGKVSKTTGEVVSPSMSAALSRLRAGSASQVIWMRPR